MNETPKNQAAIFASHARTVKEVQVKTATIWAWCPVVGVRSDQLFEREDSHYEYYRCQSCGMLHHYAVR